MRYIRMCVAAYVCLGLVGSLRGQQATTSSSSQATQLLQRSLAALVGSQTVNDVTLSGAARRIAGSDDESGTVVLKAVAGTGSRLDFTLPSGPRSEVRNTSSTEIAGAWSGPDGVAHAAAYHNLLTDPGWTPAFTTAALLSGANMIISYLGPETREGQSVIHISASQQFPDLAANAHLATLMQHLTAIEVFLDATTNLPIALTFNVHPDNNANLDIPIELRFSDYRQTNGAQIPFHIQRFLNNSLSLDLQFTSAIVNSGIPSTTFATGGAQ